MNAEALVLPTTVLSLTGFQTHLQRDEHTTYCGRFISQKLGPIGSAYGESGHPLYPTCRRCEKHVTTQQRIAALGG